MRSSTQSKALLSSAALLSLLAGVAATRDAAKKPAAWDRRASAEYLDRREVWWQSWPHATRDQGTQCISCHTQVPYALARPLLRGAMQERGLSAPEQKMLADVTKRVELWSKVEPFYKDPAQTRTFAAREAVYNALMEAANRVNPMRWNGPPYLGPDPPLALEARGTEAVLNALVLASYDAEQGHLSDPARKAFDNAWALQLKSGDDAGGWVWLNFHNTPWEGEGSAFQGATLAALAVGMAPDDYRGAPAIQPQLNLLRGYLRRQYSAQPTMNKLVVLWASSKLSGLLTPEEQAALAKHVFALQQADGGWSMTSLGSWKRHDATPLETRGDGLATGLAVLAMEQAGLAANDPRLENGLAWLEKNQDPTEGFWPAWSLNKQRDPKSDIGRFMTDAATAYATLALQNRKQR